MRHPSLRLYPGNPHQFTPGRQLRANILAELLRSLRERQEAKLAQPSDHNLIAQGGIQGFIPAPDDGFWRAGRRGKAKPDIDVITWKNFCHRRHIGREWRALPGGLRNAAHAPALRLCKAIGKIRESAVNSASRHISQRFSPAAIGHRCQAYAGTARHHFSHDQGACIAMTEIELSWSGARAIKKLREGHIGSLRGHDQQIGRFCYGTDMREVPHRIKGKAAQDMRIN